MTSPLRATETDRAPHPRPYLRVAPEPYRRRQTAAVISLAVVLVFGSLLASAVFHSVLVRGQLHLDDTQRRTEQTRLRVARDRVRLAELQSPVQLAAAAGRQGMVPATEVYAVGAGPDAPVATGSVTGQSEEDDQAGPVEAGTDEDHTTTTTEATSTSTSTPRRSAPTGSPGGAERGRRAGPRAGAVIDDDFFGRPRVGVSVTGSRTTVEPHRDRVQSNRRTTPGSPRRGGARRRSSASVVTPRPLRSDGTSRRRAQGRLAVFLVMVLLAAAGVTAKLVDLQVVSPDRYVSYGIGQRSGFRILPAGRGALLDRRGEAFALSVGEPQVVIDPSQVSDAERPRTVRALARTLGLGRRAVAEKLAATNRYQVVASKATGVQVRALREQALPGVSIEDRFVRRQPSGDLAGSVVGRALPDGEHDEHGRQGLSGIEKQFDEQLHGAPGKMRYERDPSGHTIPGGRQQVNAAKAGTDVYLTLDQALQYETERLLVEQVEATRAQGAIAVVMRPSTGEVLAMSSVERDDDGVLPTSDNQAVTSVFEPGSVNKVITIAGALEQGLVTPESMQQVPDHLQLYDRRFTDHDPHPTRSWSTTDILVTSSNIGTIGIARRLGDANLDRFLRDFGFGQRSGLGFPGESSGILRPLDDWSGVDIGAVPIGQGISVTALQMLSAYNVIANDGRYVAPKLVAATDRGAGRTPTAPSSSHQVVSPTTATAVRGMLDKVVTDGTGRRAAVPGYVVAGKTGTARIPQSGAAGSDGYKDADGRYHYQSSFVGMVDGADLSVIVTVRDAKTSIFGGDVAAPVFAHLATSALRRFQIPPPSLAPAARGAVPELSATAREVDGGMPPSPPALRQAEPVQLADLIDALARRRPDLGVRLEGPGDIDVDVTDTAHRADVAGPGALFCCVPGARHDGHRFAADAVARGAVAVLCERSLGLGVAELLVPSVRHAMGPIAAIIAGDPSDHLTVVGVTGTNGKTTTTHLLDAVFAAAGEVGGVIGTLTGTRTTPEAPELQRTLATLLAHGTTTVAMEVSSHALDLRRVDGTHFAVAVFTNLSQDHLDHHGDLESYFAAKARLFSSEFSARAVVGTDDPHGRLLLDAATIPTVGFALADAVDLELDVAGSTFLWRGEQVRIGLPGRFNVLNALAAATAAAELGIEPATIAAGLSAASPVPGRFEQVDEGQPFLVAVDYAHTPDGLEQLLGAGRELADGHRVIVVFGAGGDRDHDKRPHMGEVASRLADLVVLTTDNPRSEDPAVIIAEVRRGMATDAPIDVVPDRRVAIEHAVAAARPGDVVLVAGKGHEITQVLADRTLDFDDRLVARQALRTLRAAS